MEVDNCESEDNAGAVQSVGQPLNDFLMQLEDYTPTVSAYSFVWYLTKSWLIAKVLGLTDNTYWLAAGFLFIICKSDHVYVACPCALVHVTVHGPLKNYICNLRRSNYHMYHFSKMLCAESNVTCYTP